MLLSLTGAVIVASVLGSLPGLHAVWGIAAALVVALAAYVGLLVHMRQQATSQTIGQGASPWVSSHLLDRWAVTRFLWAGVAGWLLGAVVALTERLTGNDNSSGAVRRALLRRSTLVQGYLRRQSFRALAASAAATAGATAIGSLASAAGASPAATPAPTTAKPTVVEASVPASGSSYTVKAGDTLSSIAQRHGTSVAALAAANHIADPNVIFVGQVLVLGGASPSSSPALAPQAMMGNGILGTGLDANGLLNSLFPTTPTPSPAPSTPSPAPSTCDQTQADCTQGWGTPQPGSDEFNDTTADLATNWYVYSGPDGSGDNGSRDPGNVTEANGLLAIRGAANDTDGGMQSHVDRKYGRWEARMRVSQVDQGGNPFHPVLLLWPQNGCTWPYGEVDFAETDAGQTNTHAYLHYSSGRLNSSGCSSGPNLQDAHTYPKIDLTQFHNYAVSWEPGSITGYIDGQPWFTDTDPQAMPPTADHIDIQLDDPFSSGTANPATLQVDWMRIYNQ